jgi:hypothetical protein
MSDLAATISYLLHDADVKTLVDDQRVWAMEIPQFCLEHPDCREAQHMPRACVVVSRSGGASIGPGARSFSRWRNSRFDVFTYGATTYEAEMLQSAVYETLTQLGSNDQRDRLRMFHGTVLKAAVVTGGPLPGRDADGDWPYQMTVFDVSSIPGS